MGDSLRRFFAVACLTLLPFWRCRGSQAITEEAWGTAQNGEKVSLFTLIGLSGTEAQELLALAEAQSREAHDIFQFTSQIAAAFSPEQKVKLLEELWRAAFADGVVHEYEEYLIPRVADMLHLSHSQFIGAKLRVMEQK